MLEYVSVQRGGCTLVNMLCSEIFVSLAFVLVVLTGNLLQTYQKLHFEEGNDFISASCFSFL